jgi:hypothetical protein
MTEFVVFLKFKLPFYFISNSNSLEDCCDGSDEYNGKVKCENVCNVEAIRAKEEQEKAKVMFEAGINKKRELIEKGSELKKTMRD